MAADAYTEHARIDLAELETAARTLLGEARGEGVCGMAAVAWVVRNRLERPGWWGAALGEVCCKPRQFSCWNSDTEQDRRNLAWILDIDIAAAPMRRALGVMSQVLLLPRERDPTLGATHYFRVGTRWPNWARGKEPCARIGHHLFFNDIE